MPHRGQFENSFIKNEKEGFRKMISKFEDEKCVEDYDYGEEDKTAISASSIVFEDGTTLEEKIANMEKDIKANRVLLFARTK